MKNEKFRAWHWNKKQMYEVERIDSTRQEITCREFQGVGKKTMVFPLDSCKLQRFTRFQDMNGNEIYEDDIVVGGGIIAGKLQNYEGVKCSF